MVERKEKEVKINEKIMTNVSNIIETILFIIYYITRFF